MKKCGKYFNRHKFGPEYSIKNSKEVYQKCLKCGQEQIAVRELSFPLAVPYWTWKDIDEVTTVKMSLGDYIDMMEGKPTPKFIIEAKS